MENQPPIRRGGEHQRQPANSYGIDDPLIQSNIEQARTDAANERRRNRAQLERYADAGMDPDEAEALVEFEQSVTDQGTSAPESVFPTEADVEPEEGLERLTDHQRIYYGITEALREQRSIDHATARAIAAQLHGGQASSLHALASSGALVDGLSAELDGLRADTTPVEVEPWLDALDEYIAGRAGSPDPIEGWSALWPGDQPIDVGRLDTNQQPRRDVDRPVIGGSGTKVEQARHPIDDQAARAIARQFQADRNGPLALLAGCGAILNEDDQLYRELFADWEQHTPDQQASAEALRAYVAGREDRGPVSHWCGRRGETTSGEHPEIWVGSLTDYNNGVLHGLWIDADQDVDELRAQVGWLLRTSPTARASGDVAEEYGIFDHAGFGGYEVDEWSSLDTVALIAHGIAEHGPAYAAWVEYIGDTAGELLDDDAFGDHYEGEWDSLTDYVEYVLEETGVTEQLDRALAGFADDIRRNVQLDVAGLAEEWEQGLHVADAPGGRVWVFDARS
ncbi:MAG TPA: antirestriction protein ArdA [Pseudonocardiaceae bacterium]|jgi:antirestriction protein|nr:antirestriction protein ArdA [Pseudonocardiaceae bacterium]